MFNGCADDIDKHVGVSDLILHIGNLARFGDYIVRVFLRVQVGWFHLTKFDCVILRGCLVSCVFF